MKTSEAVVEAGIHGAVQVLKTAIQNGDLTPEELVAIFRPEIVLASLKPRGPSSASGNSSAHSSVGL
jgi:hypothetical protein